MNPNQTMQTSLKIDRNKTTFVQNQHTLTYNLFLSNFIRPSFRQRFKSHNGVHDQIIHQYINPQRVNFLILCTGINKIDGHHANMIIETIVDVV